MKEKKFTFDIETDAWDPRTYYGNRGRWDYIEEAEKRAISFDDIRPKKTAIMTKTPKETPETNRMLLIC